MRWWPKKLYDTWHFTKKKKKRYDIIMEDTSRKNNGKGFNNVIPVQVLNWESEIKDDQKQ